MKRPEIPGKPGKCWVVAADGGRARILEMGRRPREFNEVLDWRSPARSRPNRELVSDANGRAFHVKGPGGHAKESRSDAHDLEEQRFVRKLVERLERAERAKAFERLVLAADPRTLGVIRKLMGRNLVARIVLELNLDLVGLPARDLEKRIRGAISP